MLVDNPCVNDSRVIKSAQALVRGGWQVCVVCQWDAGLPDVETRNGVQYHRVRVRSPWVKRLLRRIADLPFMRSRKIRKTLERSARAATAGARAPGTTLAKPAAAKSVSMKDRLAAVVQAIMRENRAGNFAKAAVAVGVALQPEVVHSHDLVTLPAGEAIASACKARLVYDSHELEMHRNAVYAPSVQKKRREMETRGIKAADAVITVSDSIADYLAKDYGVARPHVILNSPDFGEFVEGARHVRADLGLDETVPLAVYVGSVTINRGIEYVVQALPHYPELHFATVGPVRAQTREQALELAAGLGVVDRFHVLPPVASNEVVGYIGSADVSVLPIQNVCLSYYYCMPNKLLESVFAGVPVAVADLFELRKFVGSHPVGLVMDETNPESISQVIRALASRRGDYVLGDQERQVIADRYGWAAQAEKLRGIYSGFVNS
jgi:glycosyltransferase involved in cell wall biosynthesis